MSKEIFYLPIENMDMFINISKNNSQNRFLIKNKAKYKIKSIEISNESSILDRIKYYNNFSFYKIYKINLETNNEELINCLFYIIGDLAFKNNLSCFIIIKKISLLNTYINQFFEIFIDEYNIEPKNDIDNIIANFERIKIPKRK